MKTQNYFITKIYLKALFPNIIAVLGGTINVFFDAIFVGQRLGSVGLESVNQCLTMASDMIRGRTYDAFFPLIATAVLYFLIAHVFVFLLKRVDIRLDPKRRKRAVKGVTIDDPNF